MYLVLITGQGTRIRNHYITKDARNTSNFILSIANILNVVPHALKRRFRKWIKLLGSTTPRSRSTTLTLKSSLMRMYNVHWTSLHHSTYLKMALKKFLDESEHLSLTPLTLRWPSRSSLMKVHITPQSSEGCSLSLGGASSRVGLITYHSYK